MALTRGGVKDLPCGHEEVAVRELGNQVEELKRLTRLLAYAVYDLKMCGDISPAVYAKILPYVKTWEK
jgi:hypothetical protein